MKKRTNRELEALLARAVDGLLPDVYAQVASAPLPRAAADVVPFRPAARRAPMVRRIAAACACVALLCVTGAFSLLCPAAYIGINVNPSIELTTNLFDRVLTATARNADAEAVLSGLKLRNVDLDTAVSAIIGSLVQHEYLKNGEGEIRITVHSGFGDRALRLEERLVDDVRRALPAEQQGVSVYTEAPRPAPTLPGSSGSSSSTRPATEPVDDDDHDEDDDTTVTRPATPDDSRGKKALIDCILALDPSRDAAALQRMNTPALRELAEDLADNDDAPDEDDKEDDGDDKKSEKPEPDKDDKDGDEDEDDD